MQIFTMKNADKGKFKLHALINGSLLIFKKCQYFEFSFHQILYYWHLIKIHAMQKPCH